MGALIALAIFVGIGGVVNIINLITKYCKHKSRQKAYIKIFNDCTMVQTEKDLCIQLVKRSNSYINTYFIFKVWGKVSDICSVLFSIATLGLTAYTQCAELSTGISMAAVFFVIISIYMNPGKCAKEYIEAWRKTDAHVYEIIANLPNNTLIKQIPTILSEVEKNITTDEE